MLLEICVLGYSVIISDSYRDKTILNLGCIQVLRVQKIDALGAATESAQRASTGFVNRVRLWRPNVGFDPRREGQIR